MKVLLTDLGVGAGLAGIVWALVAIAVACWCCLVRLERRRPAVVRARRRGDDRGSPIVWMHSFVLLLIPVAVMRPRLSTAWVLPCLLLFAPGTYNGTTRQTAGLLCVVALTAALALVPSRTCTRTSELSSQQLSRENGRAC